MSPRTSGSDPDVPDPDAAPEPEPAPQPEPSAVTQELNDLMAAQAAEEEAPQPFYPPGAEELTPENVRRYPDLFTDEQIASIPNEELPLTDVEEAQAAAAEAAAQEESGS